MNADRLWYVTRTDSDGAKTYALGGGLYGTKGAALRYSAKDAMRELRMALLESDRALMRGVEAVDE